LEKRMKVMKLISRTPDNIVRAHPKKTRSIDFENLFVGYKIFYLNEYICPSNALSNCGQTKFYHFLDPTSILTEILEKIKSNQIDDEITWKKVQK
jgi:hypothetical protein